VQDVMGVRLLKSVVQRIVRFCEKAFIVVPAYATFFIHHAVALAAIDGDFVRDISSRHRDFDFLYAPCGCMRSRSFSLLQYTPLLSVPLCPARCVHACSPVRVEMKADGEL
jgi:hypothetical protein